MSLEYQVFYFVYLFVTKTIEMFVKIFWVNCAPFGLLDIYFPGVFTFIFAYTRSHVSDTL